MITDVPHLQTLRCNKVLLKTIDVQHHPILALLLLSHSIFKDSKVNRACTNEQLHPWTTIVVVMLGLLDQYLLILTNLLRIITNEQVQREVITMEAILNMILIHLV